MFDEIYRCPLGSSSPDTCRCGSCELERQFNASQAAWEKAYQSDITGGSTISSLGKSYTEDKPKESVKEKVARQRKERIEQADRDWNKHQSQKPLPNYLTGNTPKNQTKSSYPVYKNTRVSPDERVRDILQSNNQDVMLLSVEEAFTYLQTEGWHKTKEKWVETTNSDLGQVMVNYGVNGKDVVTTSMIIAKLGDLGIKATVKINHLGHEIIVFSGWPNIRKILNAPRFRLDNPKVVDVGIGKYGLKNSIVNGARVTFYFAAAYRTVDYILNDQTSLSEYIGSLATDAVKIGIGSAITWGVGSVLATSFVVANLAVVVVAGLLISIGLNYIDKKFGITDKVISYLNHAQQEFVEEARKIEDGVWDLGKMFIDGMLENGKEVVVSEIKRYLFESIKFIHPKAFL